MLLERGDDRVFGDFRSSCEDEYVVDVYDNDDVVVPVDENAWVRDNWLHANGAEMVAKSLVPEETGLLEPIQGLVELECGISGLEELDLLRLQKMTKCLEHAGRWLHVYGDVQWCVDVCVGEVSLDNGEVL